MSWGSLNVFCSLMMHVRKFCEKLSIKCDNRMKMQYIIDDVLIFSVSSSSSSFASSSLCKGMACAKHVMAPEGSCELDSTSYYCTWAKIGGRRYFIAPLKGTLLQNKNEDQVTSRKEPTSQPAPSFFSLCCKKCPQGYYGPSKVTNHKYF